MKAHVGVSSNRIIISFWYIFGCRSRRFVISSAPLHSVVLVVHRVITYLIASVENDNVAQEA